VVARRRGRGADCRSPRLGCDRDVAAATDHTAESFADFFEQKINDTTTCHRTTLSGHIFAIKVCIDNRKKLVKQQYLLHMFA